MPIETEVSEQRLYAALLDIFTKMGLKFEFVDKIMKYSLKDSARQCEGLETNKVRGKTATLSNYAFPLSFASSR